MKNPSQLAYILRCTKKAQVGENMLVGLDHIGVAVDSIKDMLPLYEQLLGLKLRECKIVKAHKIKVALLTAGETTIELIEPLNKESTLSKFLEKRGQGIHHIALRVTNLESMLKLLKNKGVVLVDETPRIGVEGGKIAFLHPESTGNVLIELCE